ncbi:MAG: hypothetical protein ACFCVE_03340 [Phycisphaerae bacterium]
MAQPTDRALYLVQQPQLIVPTPEPQDAQPTRRWVYQLVSYQLSVPGGEVSRNDALWKRIDEQAVDVATYDVLWKNGIRVGIAPIAEMEHVRRHIDDPAAKRLSTANTVQQSFELPMGKEAQRQTIFWFDDQNVLRGRDFEASRNVVNVNYRPTPRQPGHTRISLAPAVVGTRKEIRYTAMNREVEVTYEAPETFYDLNLRLDVPPGHFLIIAPSPEGRWPSSVGRAFFLREDPQDLTEQVLVLVPNVFAQDLRPVEPTP